MRIIKHGKEFQPKPTLTGFRNWKKTLVCRGERDKNTEIKGNPDPCGVRFEIRECDLKHMYYKLSYGSRRHYSAVYCPECGRLLMTGDMPDPVWRRLLKKKGEWDGWQDGDTGIDISLDH